MQKKKTKKKKIERKRILQQEFRIDDVNIQSSFSQTCLKKEI